MFFRSRRCIHLFSLTIDGHVGLGGAWKRNSIQLNTIDLLGNLLCISGDEKVPKTPVSTLGAGGEGLVEGG